MTTALLGSERPSVLVLYFLRHNPLADTEQQLLNGLRKNANLLEARDSATALRYLSASKPQAVLVADASITEPGQAPLVDALVEYARAGGRVVFGVRFSSHFPYFEVAPFFRRFGMLWDRGPFYRSAFALNPNGIPEPLSEDALSPSYTMRAQLITDVPPDAAVYVTTSVPPQTYPLPPIERNDGRMKECPAAFAPLARGHIGYVGDVNGEQESTRLLLEMCGVKVALGPRKAFSGAQVHRDGRVVPESVCVPEKPLPQPHLDASSRRGPISAAQAEVRTYQSCSLWIVLMNIVAVP